MLAQDEGIDEVPILSAMSKRHVTSCRDAPAILSNGSEILRPDDVSEVKYIISGLSTYSILFPVG